MNEKILIIIVILLILLILFIPEVNGLNDGGTVILKSLTYEIIKVHKIKEYSLNEYYEGTVVRIFGHEVYNDVPISIKI